MSLPGLFQTQPEEKERKVLYLGFSDHSVQAHLLILAGGSAQIVEQSSQEQFSDTKAALLRTDECLQQLGAESESINEVLLGLDPNWVHNGEIAAEKKGFLKQLFTELSLKPLGFISFAEALAQHTSATQLGATSLLVYCTEAKIVVIHLQKGVIERAESVGRSADIVADLTEGFARFTQPGANGAHLPSTIQLASFELSEEQLQELQQQILAYSWTETKLFHQPPVVTLLSHQLTVEAIAHEASAVLAADFGLHEATQRSAGGAEPERAVETPTATMPTSSLHASAAVTQKASSQAELPTSFGIPVSPQAERRTATEGFGTLISDDAADPAKSAGDSVDINPQAVEKKHIRRSVLIGLSSGFVALVLLAVGFIFFFTTAVATITLAEKPISESIEITLDPSAAVSNPAERILAAQVVTETVTGEGVAQTTGVKIVGEQAKGDIIVYNKTEQEKTFDAGTLLSAGGIEYQLAEQITLPAALVEQTSGGEKKEYGQKATQAIAVKIGDEANTTEVTTLKVATFADSSYTAEAPKGFSGGTSREVRVVSQKDRDLLLTEVTRKVLDRANEDFKTRSSGGTYILSTKDIEVTETEYDAEVETESSVLSLNITATVSALSYSAKDLQPIAAAVLENKIPENYTLSTEAPQILSAPVQQATVVDEPVALTANISSYAVPPTNFELWKTGISGKSVSEAEGYLESLDEVQSATIELRPAVFSRLLPSLPGSPERITLELAEES